MNKAVTLGPLAPKSMLEFARRGVQPEANDHQHGLLKLSADEAVEDLGWLPVALPPEAVVCKQVNIKSLAS